MPVNNDLSSLRIIFAGTPEFAKTHLQALIDAKLNIVGVFTQPDRPAGRGKKLTPSPVKQTALEHQIEVFQPEKLRDEESQQLIKALDADVMIVVAYGIILPQAVLEMPKLGCLNVHGSLLPRWRGAAPIQRAIWAGDELTGITIMQMDAGLDTGDMLHKTSMPILPSDTSASLYEKLAQIGPSALLETLKGLVEGNIVPEKQEGSLVTYAQKLSKEEARLDWQMSASALERCIRAFNPWPMSYFMLDDLAVKVFEATTLDADEGRDLLGDEAVRAPGTLLKVDNSGLYFQTIQGILKITKVQPAGSKPMTVNDLLNGKRALFVIGKVFD